MKYELRTEVQAEGKAQRLDYCVPADSAQTLLRVYSDGLIKGLHAEAYYDMDRSEGSRTSDEDSRFGIAYRLYGALIHTETGLTAERVASRLTVPLSVVLSTRDVDLSFACNRDRLIDCECGGQSSKCGCTAHVREQEQADL